MSRWNKTQVTLRLGINRGPLTLRRTPKYLRFVFVGTDWNTLDALDQLDDTPRLNETVIAAVKVDSVAVHWDGIQKGSGKRISSWENTASYDPVSPQPPQEVLRETAKWQEWCLQQLAAQPQKGE